MRARALIAMAAVALLGFSSNQCLSRGDIYANANGAGSNLFAWSGTAPSWASSTQMATVADYTTYVKNSGSCPGSPSQIITYSAAVGCALAGGAGASAHSPLVANSSFAGGSFASWSADAVSGCLGANLFAGTTASAQDGDGGSAVASTMTTCDTDGASFATVGLSQTFSTSGTPTSQSWSFWYKAPVSIAGTSDCTQNNGSVGTLSIKINGSTVGSVSPVVDGNWHLASGTTTALANGSNTVDITVPISGANGQGSTWDAQLQTYVCRTTQRASQFFYVDNVILQGTW